MSCPFAEHRYELKLNGNKVLRASYIWYGKYSVVFKLLLPISMENLINKMRKVCHLRFLEDSAL